MNASPHLRSIACVVFAAWAWSLPALAQTKDPRTVGSEKNLSDLVLVRSTGGSAVVRFGNDPLEVVKVGDRLGRNRAEVIEIERKRLVLEERFTGRDGAPNRAQIVLRDGEVLRASRRDTASVSPSGHSGRWRNEVDREAKGVTETVAGVRVQADRRPQRSSSRT
jgi:hypothetical protein